MRKSLLLLVWFGGCGQAVSADDGGMDFAVAGQDFASGHDLALGADLAGMDLAGMDLAGMDLASAGKTYFTDFNLIELPISESGAWTNVGLDWTQVKTASGRAFGTHTGTAYNDSYAHLSGFGPDVEVSTVIYLDPTIAANYNEVEILLRWTDSAHDAHGYECNLNYSGGYAEIVRWNGALGSFTYMGGGQGAGGGHVPVNGSVFKARISGNTITTYLDGVLIQTADITAKGGAVFTTGNPGMGFYNGDSGKYGFQSYSVVSQ